MTAGKSTRSKALGVLFAGLLSCSLSPVILRPTVASADPISELQEVQKQIKQHNEDYEAATDQVDQLQSQISENEDRISEIEAELPGAQERAATSMRTLYKMQQSSCGLLELLLSSDDFYDLLSTIQYLDVIQEHSTDALDELVALEGELEMTRASLSSQMEEAEEQQEEAETALAEANAARQRLQEEIAAQAAAEEAKRKAAIEAAAKAKAEAKAQSESGSKADEKTEEASSDEGASDDSGKESGDDATFTTESGNSATVEVPEDPDPGAVVVGEKDAFISEWTSRLDAYLAGSPLAGQGKTFAEAAWEYGVDPRFSPAISMVESTQGRYCFLPHNAWGWGSSSWGSWEEAIWDHVAGLAAGYGGQLTYAGAQKYCPPNADHWYSTVLSEMQRM